MSDYSLLHRAHEALLAKHAQALAEIERLNAALAKLLPAPVTNSLPVPHRNDHDA